MLPEPNEGFTEEDLNKHIQELKQMFDQTDADGNKDGKVDAKEIAKSIR